MPNISEGLGVLAMAADMATGRPQGSGLTAAVVAAEFAKKLDLDLQAQKDAYFLAAVRFIGCTITSHETGLMSIGDDQGFAVATMLGDWTDREDLRKFLDQYVANDAPVREREKAFEHVCDILPGAAPDFTAAHCRQSFLLARRLSVSDAVLECIPYYYARWDGKVLPFGGQDMPFLSRLVRITEMAELVRRLDGAEKAKEVVSAKRGAELDPELGRIFLDHADELFAKASMAPEFETFIAAEPGEPVAMTPTCRATLAEMAADMTDHKAAHFKGHSRRVASLAAVAAAIAKLPSDQVETVRLAGLVHDIGKCAISNRIWYKPKKLGTSERLEMQRHPFQTEFILLHGEPFVALAHLASSVQERADGSGYHRRAPMTDLACNILAAANEYDEMTMTMPSQKALTPKKAAMKLSAAAKKGAFAATAVAAVLEAAGHQVRDVQAALPFGMTRREAQVLGRLAKSETTAQIAKSLEISPKTADHHIQSIYKKTGANARPALALLALEHGIIAD